LNCIDSKLSRRSRLAMAYELEARSVKGVSKRLLEYMDHVRLDYEGQRDSLRPDVQLLEIEARGVLERIAASLLELGPEERQVLELHYYQDLPASQIARRLGLSGPRRVYSILQRTLASLRRKMASPTDLAVEDDLSLNPSSDSGGQRHD